MLPKDKIIIDGTIPSEGGEIEVSHPVTNSPGQVIKPGQDADLKPFNEQLEQDAAEINKTQPEAPATPMATKEDVIQPLPSALSFNQPVDQNININQDVPPVSHAPQPDHSGMYSTNPAAAVQSAFSGSPHPTKSVIATPENVKSDVYAGPPNVQNIQPKRKKPKFKFFALIAAFVVLAGGAVYALVFYLPNTPQNVWNVGLENSGKQVDTIIDALGNKDNIALFNKTKITAEGTMESDGQTIKINIDSSYDDTSSNTQAAVRSDNTEGGVINLDSQIKTSLPAEALLPNIYFKINGFKDLGLDAYLPGLNKYDGQWISIEQDFIKQFEDGLKGSAQQAEPTKQPSYEEILGIAKDVNVVSKQYLFNPDEQSSIFIQKEFIGTEDSEGIKANHYKMTINKQNLLNYCNAMVDKLAANQTIKNLAALGDDEYNQKVQEQKDNCADTGKDLKDDETFDIWFDKKYKLFHKIRIYPDNSSYIQSLQKREQQEKYLDCMDDNSRLSDSCESLLNEPVDVEVDLGTEYTDIGQVYNGKDELKLFVNFVKEQDKDSSNSRLELAVNTKTLVFGGNYSYKNQSQYSSTNLYLDIKAEPYDGEVDSSKPSGAIPIQQLLEEVYGTANPYADIQASAQDSKRQSDISSLHTMLEAYYVQYGQYPSLKQLNDYEFRKDKLVGVPNETYADPGGSTDKLADRAGVNVYSYVVVPANCDGNNNKCTYYELSATLGDGSVYTKQSVQ